MIAYAYKKGTNHGRIRINEDLLVKQSYIKNRIMFAGVGITRVQ
jgi:hypothetical protein